MKRAAVALIACGLVPAGCEGGGPPDDVPWVETGGSDRIIEMDTQRMASGTRLGNTGAGSVPDGGVQGTQPAAGTGNDLTGGAGFQAVPDSDFIGIDEIDNFDDFRDAQGASNLNQFGAGFTVPGTVGNTADARANNNPTTP